MRSGELAEELVRLVRRADAYFIAQGVDAGPVLAADELLLMLGRETAHEQPVSGLGTRVMAEGALAEFPGVGQLAEPEVNLRDALQGLPVEILQAALLGQVPLGVAVVFEQRPAVEPDGLAVGADDPLGPVLPVCPAGVADGRQELVAVDPPA